MKRIGLALGFLLIAGGCSDVHIDTEGVAQAECIRQNGEWVRHAFQYPRCVLGQENIAREVERETVRHYPGEGKRMALAFAGIVTFPFALGFLVMMLQAVYDMLFAKRGMCSPRQWMEPIHSTKWHPKQPGSDRSNNPNPWEPYFAWRPVMVQDSRFKWLIWLQRRETVGGTQHHRFDYRDKKLKRNGYYYN